MTISSREKEVPTLLPAARLYLDDIEPIRTTILDARQLADDSQVETKFYVGDQVCTDIQELPKIGKRSRDFEMRFTQQGGFSARFGVSSRATQWTTAGLPKAETWKAFHRLEVIFDRRKIRWRNLLPRDPNLLSFVGYCLVMLLLADVLRRGEVTSYHLGSTSFEVVMWSIVLSVVLIVLAPILLLRHSVVIFRNSWDDTERREDRNTKILIAVVSALIAFVLSIVSIALKDKYWP
jgi:hypothetical protein